VGEHFVYGPPLRPAASRLRAVRHIIDRFWRDRSSSFGWAVDENVDSQREYRSAGAKGEEKMSGDAARLAEISIQSVGWPR